MAGYGSVAPLEGEVKKGAHGIHLLVIFTLYIVPATVGVIAAVENTCEPVYGEPSLALFLLGICICILARLVVSSWVYLIDDSWVQTLAVFHLITDALMVTLEAFILFPGSSCNASPAFGMLVALLLTTILQMTLVTTFAF
jgi:hypothetical protein